MNDQAVSTRFSRREFIKTTAASSAILGFPAITHSKSPNGKLNVGLIGVGGRGRSHVNACRYEDIVALCDVNANSLKGALRTAPEARTYKDLRDFFGKLEDIDAVVVATGSFDQPNMLGVPGEDLDRVHQFDRIRSRIARPRHRDAG